MATPFLPLDSNLAMDEPPSVTPVAGAIVWNDKQYCDSKGWAGLGPELSLRQTTFCDGRLRNLHPLEGRSAPPEFTQAVTGQYDVRSWRKDDFVLSIEGEKTVYIKLPVLSTVVSWTSPERMPVLTKSWRPVVFLMNPCNAVVRYTPDSCLYLSRSDANSSAWNVTPVSYIGGFCSVDPCNDKALVYGSFAIPGAVDTIALPSQPGTSRYDFFVHYFQWGFLVVPKQVDLVKGGLCSRNSSKLAFVVHPPNLFIDVDVLLPGKFFKTMQYEKDFVVTAKKTSESDIMIYLLMDGQLVSYDYSFDIRLNKPEKPRVSLAAKFKTVFTEEELAKHKAAKAEKKTYIPRISFAETDSQKVIVTEGSPLSQGHLVNEQTAAIYDAYSGMYLSNPLGIKLTKSFTHFSRNPDENESGATGGDEQGGEKGPQQSSLKPEEEVHNSLSLQETGRPGVASSSSAVADGEKAGAAGGEGESPAEGPVGEDLPVPPSLAASGSTVQKSSTLMKKDEENAPAGASPSEDVGGGAKKTMSHTNTAGVPAEAPAEGEKEEASSSSPPPPCGASPADIAAAGSAPARPAETTGGGLEKRNTTSSPSPPPAPREVEAAAQ